MTKEEFLIQSLSREFIADDEVQLIELISLLHTHKYITCITYFNGYSNNIRLVSQVHKLFVFRFDGISCDVADHIKVNQNINWTLNKCYESEIRKLCYGESYD